MEGRFVTPNSIGTSFELHPKVNPRVFSKTKRIGSLFPSKGAASHITRCQMSSSSSSEEDSHPIIEADWRSFRARLVANEVAIRLSVPYSEADHGTTLGYPPRVTVGDKWAHTIKEPEKGCLLIATEKLDGVHIFERTVVLLLSTGPIGPFGIILNRPSLMSIKEMRSAVIHSSETFSDMPLFFGGPMEEGLFLVSPKGGYDIDRVAQSGVFEEVMQGLYYGTKESSGCAAEMVKRNLVGARDFRFFDGYCVWDREQLREEISAGYWTVAACSPSVIGLSGVPSARGLWDDVLNLMGPKRVW